MADCKLKCLCSAHRELICPCPPVNIRDECTPSKGWPFPWRYFARLKTIALYFPAASASLFCLLSLFPCCFLSDSTKEPGIQTPTRWLFWGASLPSFQSAGSSLSQHLVSRIHLACSTESRVSLDSVTHCSWYLQNKREGCRGTSVGKHIKSLHNIPTKTEIGMLLYMKIMHIFYLIK